MKPTTQPLLQAATALLFALIVIVSLALFLPSRQIADWRQQLGAQTAELLAAPAAHQEVNAAWQRAVNLGGYRYTTDVIQTTIPLATPGNAGRSSKQQAIHLEGESNLREQSMHMTLWLDGGSVLDPASGVEMKVEDGKAFGRRGHGAWQETGSVTEWMAPEGDFLAFLTAARQVRNQGDGRARRDRLHPLHLRSGRPPLWRLCARPDGGAHDGPGRAAAGGAAWPAGDLCQDDGQRGTLGGRRWPAPAPGAARGPAGGK
jgi:hypothetical protein